MGWKGPGSRLTRPARPTCGRVSTAHSASSSPPRMDPRAEWRAYTPRGNLGSSRAISSRAGAEWGAASLAGGSSAAARLSLRRGREATRQRPPAHGGGTGAPRHCTAHARGASLAGEQSGGLPSAVVAVPWVWPGCDRAGKHRHRNSDLALSLSPRLSSLPSALITPLCPSTPPPPNASATTRPCICTGGVTPRACSRVGAASVDEIGTVSLPATCSRSE